MRIKVFIAPNEREEAIDAYRDRLSDAQIKQILDGAEDAWFELTLDDGKPADLHLDQNVVDEQEAPKHP